MGGGAMRRVWLVLLVTVTVLVVGPLLSATHPGCHARYLPTFLLPPKNSQISRADSDAQDANTLLSILARMRHRRKQEDDVIGQNDNDANDVRLRKRQRQCYWSVVTCY